MADDSGGRQRLALPNMSTPVSTRSWVPPFLTNEDLEKESAFIRDAFKVGYEDLGPQDKAQLMKVLVVHIRSKCNDQDPFYRIPGSYLKRGWSQMEDLPTSIILALYELVCLTEADVMKAVSAVLHQVKERIGSAEPSVVIAEDFRQAVRAVERQEVYARGRSDEREILIKKWRSANTRLSNTAAASKSAIEEATIAPFEPAKRLSERRKRQANEQRKREAMAQAQVGDIDADMGDDDESDEFEDVGLSKDAQGEASGTADDAATHSSPTSPAQTQVQATLRRRMTPQNTHANIDQGPEVVPDQSAIQGQTEQCAPHQAPHQPSQSIGNSPSPIGMAAGPTAPQAPTIQQPEASMSLRRAVSSPITQVHNPLSPSQQVSKPFRPGASQAFHNPALQNNYNWYTGSSCTLPAPQQTVFEWLVKHRATSHPPSVGPRPAQHPDSQTTLQKQDDIEMADIQPTQDTQDEDSNTAFRSVSQSPRSPSAMAPGATGPSFPTSQPTGHFGLGANYISPTLNQDGFMRVDNQGDHPKKNKD